MKVQLIAVFTEFDGLRFLLFHVEQSEGDGPMIRWRQADASLPASYRKWQERLMVRRLELIEAYQAGSEVEVEWFCEGKGWRKAALHRMCRGIARFKVEALIDFDAPKGFTAVANREGLGLASFDFPAITLKAGQLLEVSARPHVCSPANLLLEAGEFSPLDPAVKITNLGRLIDGWEPAPDMPVKLVRGDAGDRKFFAFAGRKQEIPNLEGP